MSVIKSHDFPGYDEVLVTGVGLAGYIDKSTGDFLDMETTTVVHPAGSTIKVVSPAQEERNRKYREMMRERMKQELQKALNDEQKKLPFIFIASDSTSFSGLSADTFARAAYLASHLKFGTDELWQKKTQIKRSDLPNVLRLKESASDKFWRNVKDTYFFRDNDGFVHVKDAFFVRGKLNVSPSCEYQKLYLSAIREIYEKIPPRQHKRLGYALQMLPFLNFEYNIVCSNPDETVYDKIEPLTALDFCEIVGFDSTHCKELIREFGRLTFTVDGIQEVFCRFMYDGDDATAAHIYINPRLVFKGSNFENVASIGVSFATKAKPIER